MQAPTASEPAWSPPGPLLGMVHVGPLSSAARAGPPLGDQVDAAVRDARTLADAGFDAVIVENMHDTPYVHGRQDPAVVASMTRLVGAVVEAAGVPAGVQILSGGNREAIAVAAATGANFVRCENFAYAHVADEGLLAQAEAGPLLRYRRRIGAESVAVLADVKKKHASHALTGDLTLADACRGTRFFGADAIVVTGSATGERTDPGDVRAAREAVDGPVLVGSGASPEDAAALLQHADALIVGSWVKVDGRWHNPVDAGRARRMVEAVRNS
ncbi:MAG: BtpA/SgcQ family protein [Planctomycetota bacterium]